MSRNLKNYFLLVVVTVFVSACQTTPDAEKKNKTYDKDNQGGTIVTKPEDQAYGGGTVVTRPQ